MYFRPRHRRGVYPLAQEHTLPRGVRMLLTAGAALFAAYLLWTLLLRLFGIAGGAERAGAMLAVEDRGTVSVTIDGTQQRAENGMMLFPGEHLTTGPGAHASLQFFDGSRVRLNESTEISVSESARGESDSRVSVDLRQGTLWLMTAGRRSFTGSIVWAVTSPTLSFTLSPGAEAMLSPTSLAVFSDEGEGIEVSLAGQDSIMISEGQQWALPTGGTAVSSDLYAYRAPLDAVSARSPFVLESRQKLLPRAAGTASPGRSADAEVLTLALPVNGAVLTESTVHVKGTVGAGVLSVLVNGYPALLDTAKGTFTQQLSPPDPSAGSGQGEFEVRVQALDASRTVLADVRRMVKRAPPAPLAAPTVTVPAKTGQTYRTSAEELILRGGAPSGARGIMVNDYTLQLFDPAKEEWSYVASLRLRNMLPGANVYDVFALDAAGRKSPAARITIIQGEGPEGVVQPSSAAPALTAGPLLSNAPLLPGSLTVTLPTPGTSHSETGTGFLVEGTTSAKTASIWVNDYKLQLYRAGKTTWNYIADVGLNNLKKGKNEYVIVARNDKGEILDTMTYAVEYQPSLGTLNAPFDSAQGRPR